MEEHGFLKIALCDIMDGEGKMALLVITGARLKENNIVGSHLKKYSSTGAAGFRYS